MRNKKIRLWESPPWRPPEPEIKDTRCKVCGSPTDRVSNHSDERACTNKRCQNYKELRR
jgi:hypothetical protein